MFISQRWVTLLHRYSSHLPMTSLLKQYDPKLAQFFHLRPKFEYYFRILQKSILKSWDYDVCISKQCKYFNSYLKCFELQQARKLCMCKCLLVCVCVMCVVSISTQVDIDFKSNNAENKSRKINGKLQNKAYDRNLTESIKKLWSGIYVTTHHWEKLSFCFGSNINKSFSLYLLKPIDYLCTYLLINSKQNGI